ncbi:hypothetical protein LCGC14_1766210 [marine sediment metagenome]|uniref:Uncharacterized protein n=1 Tax=marine sediment metagenome TaxID=412755 RepID=A0A0F9HM33_9ZZZZ
MTFRTDLPVKVEDAHIVTQLTKLNMATRAMRESFVSERANFFDGVKNVQLDHLTIALWHRVRRYRGVFASLDLTAATAQAKISLTDAASYDFDVEMAALETGLDTLLDATETVCNVDANGFVRRLYIKLATTGPFFGEVTPAEYAPVSTALDTVIALIEP